ncbi:MULTISPECIES: HD domain-containing protein [Pseudomonas]|jgi:hypothetical protein|uniref:Phosphohydrolase n=1 Tax=Pseudomonas fluorescens TaxID=294 RepID=A0A159ZTV8_PSEFL|nr:MULTISPECIES: HD domain-containing protein [Pseudomonas]AMZ70410.1 phosphohydrolase [Pseudomonas fluorescens]
MKIVSSSSSALDVSVGSVEWGESTKGILRESEQVQLIENLKYIFSQEKLDAERHRLGLLNPKYISIDDLLPPDTKMVRESLAYVQDLYKPTLMRHCWRTYYFGSMIALHDGIEFDRELGFASAMLHDLGLTPTADPRPCDCCFAVNGGVHARDFLLGQGFARAHADTVAHAIAVHLNYHVPAEEHGAEAFLVTRGAICDVFGTGVSRMSQQSVKDVLAKYSRDELYSVFSATAFEHLVGTRFEASFKAVTSGLVETVPHALDLPPFV